MRLLCCKLSTAMSGLHQPVQNVGIFTSQWSIVALSKIPSLGPDFHNARKISPTFNSNLRNRLFGESFNAILVWLTPPKSPPGKALAARIANLRPLA